MGRLGVRHRLTLGVGILLVLMLLLAGGGVWQLRAMSAQLENVVQVHGRSGELAQRLHAAPLRWMERLRANAAGGIGRSAARVAFGGLLGAASTITMAEVLASPASGWAQAALVAPVTSADRLCAPHPFAGLLVAQVVPHPGRQLHPLADEFQRGRLAHGDSGSHGALEGYLVLRVVVEALRSCERSLDRKCVLHVLGTRSFDLPGMKLQFGPAQRQARPFVEINLLDTQGRLRH